MVKELSPLVLYLRYLARAGELLIIDEPEMNLHPEDSDEGRPPGCMQKALLQWHRSSPGDETANVRYTTSDGRDTL